MTVAPATPLSRYPARVIAQERPLRSERADEEPRRWAWMDNLRVAVIAGVIVEHVATAYVLDIDWYYEERSAGAVTEAIVGAAILPAALFAMAVLFLVAGLLSARSLARKGPWPFVRDRLLRLGALLIAFALVIGPLTSLLGQWAEGASSADDVGSFLIAKVQDADTGPMWFVTALLVFSIAYGAWRCARPAGLTASGPLRPGHLVVASGHRAPHQNPHVPRPPVPRLAGGSRCGGNGSRPERRQSGIAAYARRDPFGSIAVARPSERAVRTESDTVRTTPVQVIAQAATVAVPTNTAVGTVKSRVRLTMAADAFTPAHK